MKSPLLPYGVTKQFKHFYYYLVGRNVGVKCLKLVHSFVNRSTCKIKVVEHVLKKKIEAD